MQTPPTAAEANHNQAPPDEDPGRVLPRFDADVQGDARARADEPAGEHAVLTVDELAALLRVDRKTVYGLIRHGEIPGVRRLGRTLRVHRGAVLAWLAEGQGRAPRPRRQP